MADTTGRKALILRYIPVDELVPYARNARKHPPKQIENLAGLIMRFGFRGGGASYEIETHSAG